MDSMLSRSDASTRYNIGQIADLRETLVEYYGAKKASGMTSEEIRVWTAGRVKK